MAGMRPSVKNQRCVRYRFRHSQCDTCVQSCPHGALDVHDEGVTLRTADCRGCGLCVSACPTEALEWRDAVGGDWLKHPPESGTTVACAPSEATGDLRVPCLGGLDPVALVSVAQQGIQIHLAGGHHCKECAHAPAGRERLDSLLGHVAQLEEHLGAGAWALPQEAGAPEAAKHRAKKGMDRKGASRRQFFRRLAAPAQQAAETGETVDEPLPAEAIRAAPHYLPPRRQRLVELLGEKGLDLGGGLGETLGAGTVAASGDCNGCEACFRACPTGAIDAKEVEGAWTLAVQPEHCVGCGVCVETCTVAALAPARDLPDDTGSARVLFELRQSRCRDCGRFYVDDGHGCPVCQDDDDVMAQIFG